jgi:TM2 domain-containing membrane protein YozV
MNEKSTSYILWATWFLGLAGFHRLYNGKIFTGLVWLFTWGMFGFGQFVDLFLIPGMVDEHNARARARLGTTQPGYAAQPTIQLVISPDTLKSASGIAAPASGHDPRAGAIALTPDQIKLKLLKAAQARGGKLSVTQGVLDTGVMFDQVEMALQDMVKSGYVAVANDPDTGIVVYDFVEL